MQYSRKAKVVKFTATDSGPDIERKKQASNLTTGLTVTMYVSPTIKLVTTISVRGWETVRLDRNLVLLDQ